MLPTATTSLSHRLDYPKMTNNDINFGLGEFHAWEVVNAITKIIWAHALNFVALGLITSSGHASQVMLTTPDITHREN